MRVSIVSKKSIAKKKTWKCVAIIFTWNKNSIRIHFVVGFIYLSSDIVPIPSAASKKKKKRNFSFRIFITYFFLFSRVLRNWMRIHNVIWLCEYPIDSCRHHWWEEKKQEQSQNENEKPKALYELNTILSIFPKTGYKSTSEAMDTTKKKTNQRRRRYLKLKCIGMTMENTKMLREIENFF